MQSGSTPPQQDRNDDRLSMIEERLRHIEKRLGLMWVEPPRKIVPPTEAPPPLPQTFATDAATGESSSAQPTHAAQSGPAPIFDIPPNARREAARQWLANQRVPQPETKTDWANLEQRIGQRWTSIAGALLFIIGMGLLFAVAWRRGWFQNVPPGLKCILGSLVGFAMLVGANVVRKKWSAMAAIGLNAAGLGVVYLSAYVSFATFHLVSPGVAFAMLACVAFMGIAISARSQFATVGVVALIGGYLTPLLVHTDNPSPWVMPIHLTVLLGLAVGLTIWRGPMFMAVRTTALIGTLIIGAVWVLGSNWLPLLPVLLFIAAAWALLNFETLKAVNKWALGTTAATISINTSILGSVSITGWAFCIATVFVHRNQGFAETLDWTVPLILAAACAVLAWLLVPSVKRLFSKPSSPAEIFACVLTCEVFALIPMAVALAFTDWLRLAAWGFIAIAAAFAARRTKLWALASYAVILLTITLFQLVCIESWRSDVLSVGTLVQGVYFSRWMATAAVLAVAWLWVARLIGLPDKAEPKDQAEPENALSIVPFWRLPLARITATTGTALCFVLWLHIKTEPKPLTFILPLVACVLLLARGLWPRLWVDHAANVSIMLIDGFWLVVYFLDNWLSSNAPAFMHPGLLSSFVIAASALIGAWLTDNTGWSLPPRSNRTIVGWSVAGGTLFVSTSFEIARVAKIVFSDETARSSAVSVWWALVAIGLIVLGFKILRPWPRRVGLGLLGLALAKVVIYDLGALSLEWRTVSFLVLGSVMLGVGLVYGKVSAKIQKTAQEESETTTNPT